MSPPSSLPPDSDSLLLSPYITAPLALLSTCILLAGTLGNLLVLYASLRHSALRLDPASLLLVQNLALADLGYILTTVFPATVTYIAGRYLLGPTYCFVNAVVFVVPGTVNTLTVLTLTAYRLFMIKAPTLQRRVTLRMMRGVIATIWLLATGPLWVIVSYRGNSVFRQTYAACVTDVYEKPAAKLPVQLTLGLVIIAPLLLTTAINVYLCLVARSLRRTAEQKIASLRSKLAINSSLVVAPPPAPPRYRNNPLVTVCLLSGCFILSWMPYVVYVMWKTYNPHVPVAMELCGFHAIHLNTAVNPILFTVTCRRFRSYVRGLLPGSVRGCQTSSDPARHRSVSAHGAQVTQVKYGSGK